MPAGTLIGVDRGCDSNVRWQRGPMSPLLRRFRPAAIVCAILLAGCSPPEARNEGVPDDFSSLPPARRELVKEGRVAVGFDPDTVRLALGDPDRVTTRSDADGDIEVWHFTSWDAEGHALFTGTYLANRRHGFGWNNWWGPAYPYYLDFTNRVIHDRFTVEFRDGRVSAVIREQPSGN